MGREFAYVPGDWGSIAGQVIPKTQKKWYVIPPCLILSLMRYVSWVKWSNPGKGVAPFPTSRVLAIEKGAFRSPSTTASNFFSIREFAEKFMANQVGNYFSFLSIIVGY